MRRNRWLSFTAVLLGASLGLAQAKPESPASVDQAKSGNQAPAPSASKDRDAVLARMNQTAPNFHAAQGDFEFETYEALTKDTDHQTGRIYFRRTKNNNVDAAFNISGRAPKQVVYKDGKISVYEQKIDQVTEHDVGANKGSVEAFLSLGFGARGDDLLRDYEVKMDGWEAINGVKTARLELVPKQEKLRQTYTKIVLWVDPERDLLLQQQFFEKTGDYRLARYTRMELTSKLSDDVFRLKTGGNTKTIKSP